MLLFRGKRFDAALRRSVVKVKLEKRDNAQPAWTIRFYIGGLSIGARKILAVVATVIKRTTVKL